MSFRNVLNQKGHPKVTLKQTPYVGYVIKLVFFNLYTVHIKLYS